MIILLLVETRQRRERGLCRQVLLDGKIDDDPVLRKKLNDAVCTIFEKERLALPRDSIVFVSLYPVLPKKSGEIAILWDALVLSGNAMPLP